MNGYGIAALGVAWLVWLGSAQAIHADELPERAMGNANAPVTIIEYASMTCPHCATFHNERFPWLKETYIDTGKVRFVFRDFPLDSAALMGALVTHCVDPDRYFEVVAMLFKHQEDWAFASKPRAALRKLAEANGMSQDDYKRCLADEPLMDRIIASRLNGQEKYNIKATPSLIIGDVIIDSVPSNEDLAEAIAKAGG